MRKSTKIAVVLAAAALLVAGFAFTTLAKGWVKEGEGLYYYEDEYGMKEYNTWEKDGANYYYLGDDGYMVTNTLVSYDGEYYWCGADGAKVVSQWQQVEADDLDKDDLEVEYRWYYFNDKGKALKSVKKTIDGKTYFFNADGKMLFGYVNGDAFTMTKSVTDAYIAGSGYKFYCGSNEEGWARKGEWVKETVDASTDTYEDSTNFWAYYKASGEKASTADENGVLVNGQRYYFNADGKMLTGWTATNSDCTASYFGGADDGKMVKKGWAYVKPQSGGDDKYWFYFNADGIAVGEACVKRINGKVYAFGAPVKDAKKGYYTESASRMLSGMVVVTIPENGVLTDATDAKKINDYLGFKIAEKVSLADWIDEPFDFDVYYFSGDEANDGSLKKSTTFTQDFKDDTYTLAVDKEGKLTNGYVSKKYYINGYLMKAAEDMRYEVKKVYTDEGSKYALLSAAGSEATKGVVADADGNYYSVLLDDDSNSTIYMAKASGICPAQTASNWYKSAGDETATFKFEGTEYKVVKGDTKNGVTEIKAVKAK